MRRSLNTIVGLGIVTALFMAIMSMFYLQQIPTQADLDRLEDDVRREHGLYLSAASDVNATLIRPEHEGEHTGLDIECTLRPDLRREPKISQIYLSRIAESVIAHPQWRGRVAYVTVRHSRGLELSETRWVGKQDGVKAAAPAEPAPRKKPASAKPAR